jgi:hypothetical protein
MPRRKKEETLTDAQVWCMVQEAVAVYGGQRKTAMLFGIAQPYLSRYLNGRECAGPAILKVIGLRRLSDRYAKL